MLIRLGPFKGMAPSIAADMLADGAAQNASNVRLGFGDLRPLKDAVLATTGSGSIKSIAYVNGAWHLSPGFKHVVPSPVQDDAYDRTYWTESGSPAKYKAVGGADYTLGVVPPTDPPSAVVDDTNRVAGWEDHPEWADTRAYVYTWVTEYGEEGPPSAPSAAVDVYPGDVVTVTMGTSVAGNYNVKFKLLYRTNTGSTTTEYQLAGYELLATPTLEDSKSNAELGEVLPSGSWHHPPLDLICLTMLPNGVLAGISGKEICFSESFRPHAWPIEYRVPLEYTGKAMAAFGNTLLIATDGPAFLATGAHPSAMAFEKMEIGYGCVSGYGMVDMGYACIYPAVNGLMYAAMGDVKLLTEGILTKADWQALNPSSITAGMWDNKYVGFWDNAVSKGFVYDPRTGDFSLHDIAATAAYTRPDTGSLYIAVGSSVLEWDKSATAKTYTWKSKRFALPWNTNLGCAQVFASSYPTSGTQITAKFYADGVLKHTQTVLSKEPFRLPSGFRALYWEVEVTANVNIQQILLASTMAELAQV